MKAFFPDNSEIKLNLQQSSAQKNNFLQSFCFLIFLVLMSYKTQVLAKPDLEYDKNKQTD